MSALLGMRRLVNTIAFPCPASRASSFIVALADEGLSSRHVHLGWHHAPFVPRHAEPLHFVPRTAMPARRCLTELCFESGGNIVAVEACGPDGSLYCLLRGDGRLHSDLWSLAKTNSFSPWIGHRLAFTANTSAKLLQFPPRVSLVPVVHQAHESLARDIHSAVQRVL